MSTYSTIIYLISGLLYMYVRMSNCFMSTYFTDMCLVSLFHSIQFYVEKYQVMCHVKNARYNQ